MKISTKGRYALRVMIYLAQNSEKGFISLQEVAKSENISLKYLEALMSPLIEAELIESVRGKFGGYRLAKSPEEITAGNILKAVCGDLSPVACLEKNAPPCPRANICKTLSFWRGLDGVIDNYLEGKTLADFLKETE